MLPSVMPASQPIALRDAPRAAESLPEAQPGNITQLSRAVLDYPPGGYGAYCVPRAVCKDLELNDQPVTVSLKA